jgi:steroid delta-isomerase-like uncharacterized protein
MDPQTGETLVRRYYEEALNNADWAALGAIVAADFVDHETLLGIAPTRDGLRQKYELLRTGFPDLRFDIEELLPSGDKVTARVTVRGTHTGLFMGRPPTQHTFSATSIGIFRIAQAQIVVHWGVFDQIGMLMQLRALPGMGS